MRQTWARSPDKFVFPLPMRINCSYRLCNFPHMQPGLGRQGKMAFLGQCVLTRRAALFIEGRSTSE